MITPREKEIVCRIVHGEKLSEIAKNMNLSSRTIDNCLRALKTRFDCSNVPQLSVKLSEAGLLAE